MYGALETVVHLLNCATLARNDFLSQTYGSSCILLYINYIIYQTSVTAQHDLSCAESAMILYLTIQPQYHLS